MKAKTLNSYKGKVLQDLKEAIDEFNLIKTGKLKARNAEDLFGEL